MTDVQPLQSGDPPHLGGYRLVGRLGAGGQGAVYLVETPNRPGEQFALKLLHAQLIGDADARHRFLREVEVAKRVARFSTAQVIETGENGDQPYIVSEYVPGPSLQELVNTSGPLTSAALDRLAVNTATALAAIHRAGVLHRDFKPGNVLLGPHGPVVIDFGIARALDSTGGVTMSSQVVGTPAFMAPEQIAGAEIGPAADLFAWAITMVYAANGRAAFVQNSIPALFQRILTAEPDLGVLDGSLRQIVDACLAKDPGARPTADQVVAYLTGATAPELPQPASPR